MNRGAISCEAQIIIDEEISQLEESIQRLKNKRNHHTLVAKLPFEVLGEVFFYAELVSRTSKDGFLEHILRFNFSHVCQHWRVVALATPAIWSSLPENVWSKWSSIMIERSSQAGLRIDSFLHDWDTPQERWWNSKLQEVVVTHSDKLVELTISSNTVMPITHLQMFFNNLPTSAHRLRHLGIILDSSYRPWPQMSEKVFSGARLATFELRGCGIDWTSNLLTGLEVLKITVDKTTSLLDFLEALKRMPSLKHLSLKHPFPFYNPPLSNTQILLSSLEVLDITTDPSGIASLLLYLVVPTSAVIHLHTFGGQAPESWSSSIRTFFSSMTADGEDEVCTYQTLSISNDHRDGCTTVEAWHRKRDGPLLSIRSDDPEFILTCQTVDPWLVGIFRSLPLSKLNTLQLQGVVSHSLLIDSFGSLPKLETVIFDGTSQFTKTIQLDIHGDDDDSSIPFPHLRNFLMRRVIFSNKLQPSSSISHDSLRECLLDRHELGAPIQNISICESSCFNQDDVQALKEIVTHVVWDGLQVAEEEDNGWNGNADWNDDWM